MNQFAIGDRVLDSRKPGRVGTVWGIDCELIQGRYDVGGHFRLPASDFSPHVDTFPISADKDPWRESEPRELRGPLCGETHHDELSVRMATTWECNRVRFHGGHHVARVGVASEVYARWPREVSDEKPVPVVGMAVVRTELETNEVQPGCRGRVTRLDEHRRFYVKFEGRATEVMFDADAWGWRVVSAAEWDARQKRDTERAPPPYANETIHTLAGGFAVVSCGTADGGLDRPAPHYRLSETFTARLAIAMLEDDNAGVIARVTGDGRQGGISVAEARERLVWMSAEPQREQYMREASALLKRAGELQ